MGSAMDESRRRDAAAEPPRPPPKWRIAALSPAQLQGLATDGRLLAFSPVRLAELHPTAHALGEDDDDGPSDACDDANAHGGSAVHNGHRHSGPLSTTKANGPLGSPSSAVSTVTTTSSSSSASTSPSLPPPLPLPTTSRREAEDASTEVVALGEGELDPLGAMLHGTDDGVAVVGNDDDQLRTGAHLKGDQVKRPITLRATSTGSYRERDVDAPQTIKELWRAHKDRVLTKYSDATFEIKASMLELNELEAEIAYTSTTAYQPDDEPGSADGVHVVRKSRDRLAQLEERIAAKHDPSNGTKQVNGRPRRGDQKVQITQGEYIARIKQLEADLVKAWKQNMKVQALRLAIKCVKQISDTSSAPELYPCAFVLVSDVLDTFGQLVYERIKSLASEDPNGQPLPTPLGDIFTSDEVNIQAKETCRNWFYKTACIRELLPRIYIEIALLKCYRFLCDGEYPQIVARLSNMIKGVGEPMVALYTRLYLSLTSSELVKPTEKAGILSSIYDYLFTFQQYQMTKLDKFLHNQGLPLNDYLALHSPAVEWLMKCAAYGDRGETFDVIMAHYRQFSDNSMVLKHLCESFGPDSYAANPFVLLQQMRIAAPSQFSTCHLYSILAVQLTAAKTIAHGNREDKLRFLNDAWTSITAQESIDQYMECAAAYMKLIVAHYSHREAMILLRDVVRHLNSASLDDLTSRVYNLLGAVIENVVYGAQRHVDFFTRIIPSGEFLTLMGMFRREATVGVAKKVLHAFVNTAPSRRKTLNPHIQSRRLGDLRLPVVGPEAAVAQTLFVLCCRVHDSLDSLSTYNERAEATKDIIAFVSRLGYVDGSISEAELQEEEEALLLLYTDCRSAFYKLEHIKHTLTKFVLALAVRVQSRFPLKTSKSKSSRIEVHRDFVKSCVAFAHITIPSISNVHQKLELLVLATKVAIASNCQPQLEALLKGSIMLVADLDFAQSVNSCVVGDGEVSREHTPEEVFTRVTSNFARVMRDLVSVVLFAPSLTDEDPFYFVDALHRAVSERMTWDTSASAHRVQLEAFMHQIRLGRWMAELFCLWGQRQIPGRIPGVDSNDVLYGGDSVFEERLDAAFSSIVEEVVTGIEGASHMNIPTKALAIAQAELMLEFVDGVGVFLSLDEDAVPATEIAVDVALETSKEQRRKARSGAILLRKCLAFARRKIDIVSEPPVAIGPQKDKLAQLQVRYLATLNQVKAQVGVARKSGVLLQNPAKEALASLETWLAGSGGASGGDEVVA